MDQESGWYAVYTKSRQEKSLLSRLSVQGIESYVPLRKTLKQWSDRKKWVEEVLIRSYVFVKVRRNQYDAVLNTPGAVRFIWFDGKPARIPERQIDFLKRVAGSDTEITLISRNFRPGTPVRIIAGPFQGFTGELLASEKKHQVVLRIDHIDIALSLTISPEMIEEVTDKQ